MKFTIINPSDPYTMEASCLMVAAVAICLLGEGAYALKGIGADIGQNVPLFLLGGHEEWFTKTFGMGFRAALEKVDSENREALVAALASVKCPGRTTSLNDIGAQAQVLSKALRAAPQPVHKPTEGS